MFSEAGPLLAGRGGRRVVILAAPGRLRYVTSWLAHFSDDHVHVVGPSAPPTSGPLAGWPYLRADSLEEIDVALRHVAGIQILIDLREGYPNRYRDSWAALAVHLAEGGVYVAPSTSRRRGIAVTAVAAVAAELTGAGRTPPDGFVGTVTAGTALLRNALIIVKRGSHHYLTRDSETHTLLRDREPALQVEVLDTLPAGELSSRVAAHSHNSTVPVRGFADVMTYPALELRRYTGPIHFGGRTLLYSGHTVLADSYRFFAAANAGNPGIRKVTPSFGSIPAGMRATEPLPGEYYLLDPQWTGHFGHIMTEVVPRLWGWDTAKRRYPALKVLAMTKRNTEGDPLLERLVTGYGIELEDIVIVDHPVVLDSVITAQAMWHNYRPHFVHPGIADIWNRIAPTIVDAGAPTHERIFVSRQHGFARTCRNSADVERLFESYGFTVVLPEQLDLGEQAKVFRDAKIIAGFGGSAMFNLMYAQQLERLIMLGHEAYQARNEHLYSAVLGGRADYFWSTPDIPQWTSGYNWRAFVSDWEFDFERNQTDLENLLRSLG